MSRYSYRGFTELPKAVRRKDPPSAAQAAVEQRFDRKGDIRQDIIDQIERLAVRLVTAEPVPAPAPIPPHVPRPGQPAGPAPPKLQYDARCGWHIPCSLSQSELRSTEPSAELRRWRQGPNGE
jgi:hypothetical protein